MGAVINGRNLNLYYTLNGVKYPICHATDCKLTFTADTQETTTKNSLRGSTFDYTGKYKYELSLKGITALNDIPAVASITGSLQETDPNTDVFNDANVTYFDNGSPASGFPILISQDFSYDTIAGHTGSFLAFCEQAPVGDNPLLNMQVYKNGQLVFQQSTPVTTTAQLQYNIVAANSAQYTWNTWTVSDGVALPSINIPDSTTINPNGVPNVSLFQDALLQFIKLPFIFTDNQNILWSGTVLVTQSDLDSPVDNTSTFTQSLLGDGEIVKVTSGLPPPATDSVLIEDQFGDILATVQAPGVYNVTRFDTIDCRGWASPVITITSTTS